MTTVVRAGPEHGSTRWPCVSRLSRSFARQSASTPTSGSSPTRSPQSSRTSSAVGASSTCGATTRAGRSTMTTSSCSPVSTPRCPRRRANARRGPSPAQPPPSDETSDPSSSRWTTTCGSRVERRRRRHGWRGCFRLLPTRAAFQPVLTTWRRGSSRWRRASTTTPRPPARISATASGSRSALPGSPATAAHAYPPSGASTIVVTIEETSAAERLDLFARACGLTGREVELLGQLTTGSDTRALARQMSLSEHTIQDHLESIFAKTGTRDRVTLLSHVLGTRRETAP